MKSCLITDANVHISRLVPGGQAIATLEDDGAIDQAGRRISSTLAGRKAFFWNALPGETVLAYQITKSKKNYLEAIATQLAEPLSPHRIQPRDDCYLATSPWQILDFDYELMAKAALVAECFRQEHLDVREFLEIATESPKILPIFRKKSPPKTSSVSPQSLLDKSQSATITDHREFFYRNKMEYSLYFDHADRQIRLAFHLRGSHRKLPITQSSLERPEIFNKAKEIVDRLNAERVDARQFQSLMLRCSEDGTVSGGLFVNNEPHPNFPPLTDRIADRSYTYSPSGFFQINLPVYELALAHIAPYINTQKVLDLYAGVGTIGLTVAADRDLTLVECNKAAYQELVRNCEEFCGRNCEPPRVTPPQTTNPILAKSEEALDFIQPDTTVILDPPRAGCAPELIARLLAQTPPTIIYLSCNPITQARDISRLTPKYRIVDLIPFNFFPRTPHIENLVILQIK